MDKEQLKELLFTALDETMEEIENKTKNDKDVSDDQARGLSLQIILTISMYISKVLSKFE